jgi:hypothetical protein
LAGSLAAAVGAQSSFRPAAAPSRVRLYVLDCGLINVNRAGDE